MNFRYVHNNIFFSFAVDADLEHISKRSASDGSSKVQGASSLHGPSERAIDSSLHGDNGLSNGERSNSSCTSEANGITESSPDGSTETQLTESEQATYASANNDLKGTKAYQEADVPGLYNLAMAIIDYRGHRVVAQVRLSFSDVNFCFITLPYCFLGFMIGLAQHYIYFKIT